MALLIWSFAAFFELQGPVNLFHEPAFPLSIALVFWAIASTAAAMATVAVIEGARAIRGLRRREAVAEGSMSMPGSVIQGRPLHLGEEIAARVAPKAGLREVLQ